MVPHSVGLALPYHKNVAHRINKLRLIETEATPTRYESEPGTLHISYGCVTGCFVGLPKVEVNYVPNSFACAWDPFPPTVLVQFPYEGLCLVLM